MKILIVGATGTIGRAVVEELGSRHEIVMAGRTSGDVNMDITDPSSMQKVLDTIGSLDAIVSAAGSVKFAPLEEMTDTDYEIGLKDKLMGQINLVLLGRHSLSDGGSFTLTTGILDRDPIRFGSSASMVNGAVNSFVRAAAIELPRGLRINAVSPGVIQEAMESFAPYFRGFEPVPAARAALAYSKSVEGHQTGQVYCVN